MAGLDSLMSSGSSGSSAGSGGGWAEGIAGGTQILSGVAQMYQTQKANKANQAKLEEIENLFNSIKPPGYDMSVQDPPEYIMSVPEAAFDFSKLTPKQFEMVGKFSPQAAAYVAEKNPEVVQKSGEAKQGREAQMAALQKFRDIAQSGTDPLLEQQMAKASENAQIAAQSRQQSILQDAARRGQMGSGATLAAQLQGGSDAMQRASSESQAAAAEAYRARLDALRTGASLGGDIAQSELNQAGKNADIINAFNQRAATNQNAYGQYATGVMNDAQLRNLAAQQDIANRNVDTSNQYDQMNQQNFNKLQQQQYQNRVNAQMNKNQLLGQQSAFKAGQVDRLNQLRQQQFNDQMGITNRQGNVGMSQIDLRNQATGATNKNIQGIGNAISSTAMAYKGNGQPTQGQPQQQQTTTYGKRLDEDNPYGNYA
jgi:hypothetical protein